MKIDGKPVSGFGLITLEPAGGKWKPRTPKRGVIEQRGREFLPRVAAVAVVLQAGLAHGPADAALHPAFWVMAVVTALGVVPALRVPGRAGRAA